MKNIFICFLFTLNCCYSQQFSVGLVSGVQSFSGNNFMAKTYKNHFFSKVDARQVFKNKIGVGAFFSFALPNIATTEFIGNSSSARVTEFGVLAFYNVALLKKWAFIPKVGIGYHQLKNTLDTDNTKSYFTNGTVYNLGSELQHKFNDDFSLNVSFDYGYIDLSHVKASSLLGTSYQSANKLGVSAGVRFYF